MDATSEEYKNLQRRAHAAKARLQKAKNMIERILKEEPVDQKKLKHTEGVRDDAQKFLDNMEPLPDTSEMTQMKIKGKAGRPINQRKPSVFVVPVEKAMDENDPFLGIVIDKEVAIPLNAVYGKKRIFAYPFEKMNKGDSFTTGLPYETKNVMSLKNQLNVFIKENPKEKEKEFLISADAKKQVRCWRLK